MKKFMVRSSIFMSPILLIAALTAWVLHTGGEFVSVDEVVRRQSNGERVLWCPAYTSPLKYYKLRGAQAARAKVVALGTSRILQIRQEFFRPEIRFFNAGNGIERLGQMRKFLEGLTKEQAPELLIISLDQNFFNEGWDNFKDDNYERELSRNSGSVNILIKSWDRVIADYMKGKFSVGDLKGRPSEATGEIRIGINSIVNSNYFRPDGTHHYGKYILESTADPPDEGSEFASTFDMMKRGVIYFRHGRDVSAEAVRHLRGLLAYCSNRNIKVVAFLPPYAVAICEKIKAMRNEYSYMFKLRETLAPVFDEFGFELFDFTDPGSIGSDRREYYDGFHASEKAYLRMFIKMAGSGKLLKEYGEDPESLKLRLAGTKGPYEVFE